MQGRLSEAQQGLVTGNLGLVRAVLRHYGRLRNDEDLYSVGCFGLCKAALHWEAGKSPFSTYACHFIHHEIINYLRDEKKNAGCLSLDELEHEPGAGEGELDGAFRSAERQILIDELFGQAPSLLTPNEIRVLQMLRSGGTPAQAAVALGIPRSRIYRMIKKATGILACWAGENGKI